MSDGHGRVCRHAGRLVRRRLGPEAFMLESRKRRKESCSEEDVSDGGEGDGTASFQIIQDPCKA
eukprot:460953-Hanusia_phi.AAC.1